MKIHFIALGGSAMHNLALALHHKGYQISGSDDAIYEPSKSRLAQAGLLPQHLGWYPDRITNHLDGVVLGMHAKSDNPELLKAQELELPIYSYPEFLFEANKDKTRVVIGGSHGKTTITAMILHVMKYWQREVDFMVGAQLDGYDVMVQLTDENEFVVLEGDEYLSSPIDMRPKFHWYQPNMALISGIAWDHVNVFPTVEDYNQQFEIFIKTLTPGGVLVYNNEDEILRDIVEKCDHPIRKIPYSTMDHFIDSGVTFLDTSEGPLPLKIFGQHNISNLSGAMQICQHMGIEPIDFLEAMASFSGASKRLQTLVNKPERKVFRDFAHAPSKVLATVEAVKTQFSDQPLLACLELHTFSSLDPSFVIQYRSTLDAADAAVVFYDREAVVAKGKKLPSPESIINAFQHKNIQVVTDRDQLKSFLLQQPAGVLLLMSSGHFGGIPMSIFLE
jgi:UDP-N-acetylmuramate: L-alanyl-gamma-D-glutamyl-meso-diaminopimelate ligase